MHTLDVEVFRRDVEPAAAGSTSCACRRHPVAVIRSRGLMVPDRHRRASVDTPAPRAGPAILPNPSVGARGGRMCRDRLAGALRPAALPGSMQMHARQRRGDAGPGAGPAGGGVAPVAAGADGGQAHAGGAHRSSARPCFRAPMPRRRCTQRTALRPISRQRRLPVHQQRAGGEDLPTSLGSRRRLAPDPAWSPPPRSAASPGNPGRRYGRAARPLPLRMDERDLCDRPVDERPQRADDRRDGRRVGLPRPGPILRPDGADRASHENAPARGHG